VRLWRPNSRLTAFRWRSQCDVSIMTGMTIVVDWNGDEIPEGMEELPKGRYVLVAVDDAPILTKQQEAGIEAALASVRAGRGIPGDVARERVNSQFRR